MVVRKVGVVGQEAEGGKDCCNVVCRLLLNLDVKKKKKNRIQKCMNMYVRSCCWSLFYPCTLPTAPVSRSFGLRSSYESVSLTPTKDQGKWNVTPLTAQRDPLAFAFLLLIHLKLGTHQEQHTKTQNQLLPTANCVNCLLCNHTHYSTQGLHKEYNTTHYPHFSCRAAALLAANRQNQSDLKRHPTSAEQHDQSNPTPGQQCTPPSHRQPNNNGQ